MFSSLDKQLLNDFQQDIPLSATPYQDIAESLGVTEDAILTAFKELQDQKFITRIGSVIAPNLIGVSALIAMSVPKNQLQHIATVINQYPEVNHNYERDNRFNLWFVLVANDSESLQAVMKDMEYQTGCKMLYLPLLEDYFINLGFEIDFND